MKELFTTNGYKFVIDDEDFNRVNKYKWNLTKRKNGRMYITTAYYDKELYLKNKNGMVNIKLYRFIMNIKDSAVHIDHKDNDIFNNQKSNLRKCTHSENMRNRSSHKNTTSKYLGVCIEKGRYSARICHNGIKKRLGVYDNEIDAAIAYNKKAIELHGEYANLNLV